MSYPIEGYVCHFNKTDQGGDLLTQNILSHQIVTPTKIKMLYQHDITRPIGRWYHIEADSNGIYAKGEIDTEFIDGQYVSHLIKNHLLDGLSIGFIPLEHDYRADGVRIIHKIDLREVSIVTFPMQADAHIYTPEEVQALETYLEG